MPFKTTFFNYFLRFGDGLGQNTEVLNKKSFLFRQPTNEINQKTIQDHHKPLTKDFNFFDLCLHSSLKSM